jgi:hypothetical protein
LQARMRRVPKEPGGYKTIWGAEICVNTRNKTAAMVTSASGVNNKSPFCSHVNHLNNRVC